MTKEHIATVLDKTKTAEEREEALWSAFIWGNTNEGHEYWERVLHKVRAGEPLTKRTERLLHARLKKAS